MDNCNVTKYIFIILYILKLISVTNINININKNKNKNKNKNNFYLRNQFICFGNLFLCPFINRYIETFIPT